MLIRQGLFAVAVSGVVLSGCASLSSDRGVAQVRRMVADRSGHDLSVPDADTQKMVTELLGAPLDADRAAQVALINNPQVRGVYARLGIAAADVYDAGRLSNPSFNASLLFSNRAGAADQMTFGLAQSFTDLLLLPARSRLAKGDFERAQQQAGASILALAADAQYAYYALVGARQVAAMRATVARAAQAGADLAQRFFDAGNISALDLALGQSAASQARLAAMQADLGELAARSALSLLMGLPADDGRWQVPDRLPVPLEREDDVAALLDLAWRARADLAAKDKAVDLLADHLGVTRRYRYVGELSLGVETSRETDRERITGPSLSVELPIFNTGVGKVARAEALLAQAEVELAALRLEVAHGVRLVHAKVMAARARVEQFRDALIPQREAVVLRTQEEVNFMLKGQFELLLAKQQEYDAYQGYLEAVRDYWLARTELSRQVGARLPSQVRADAPTPGPMNLPEAPPAEEPRQPTTSHHH